MFTLVMSLGLVAVVAFSGYTFSRKMDELFADRPAPPASDTQFG
ncbi:hypothetical protein [Variovorax sp. PAMC 28711]|nr:hypothetical protein [Variovorax sp. PAMC 28711]